MIVLAALYQYGMLACFHEDFHLSLAWYLLGMAGDVALSVAGYVATRELNISYVDFAWPTSVPAL